MKKLRTMYQGDMVLKYQLILEDLKSLVSIQNDEDLRHMLEEYDRQDPQGNPKLRTFLFPSNPVILENQTGSMDPQTIEQHYTDAINGIVHTTGHWRLPPINASRPSFSISSACSSPNSTSPENIVTDLVWHLEGYQGSRLPKHSVKSLLSLCSLGGGVSSGCFHCGKGHHFHQQPQHFHANHQQLPPCAHGYPSLRSPYVSLATSFLLVSLQVFVLFIDLPLLRMQVQFLGRAK